VNPAARSAAEAGLTTLTFPLLLWIATLAAIALVDVTGYLVAAARAQSLADAAALAAVSASASTTAGTPVAEAERVVVAGAGRLEACTCRPGAHRAAASVSVPVVGLVVPRVGAARVAADAHAVLTSPAAGHRSIPTSP
jgi:hypothetical protein